MIPIALILALTAAGITLLALYWRNIVGWIQKATAKIKEVLGSAVDGVRTFIVRTAEGLKNKSKYYYRNNVTREWEELISTKNVDESEVPADILAKAKRFAVGTEVSTTEELRLAINA